MLRRVRQSLSEPPTERISDPVLEHRYLAVARSDQVKDQPLQVHALGERLVLFRTADGLHAFRDLCLHRGAELSLGRVEQGTLVCPYHGWRYDGSGRCVHIPAQPEGQGVPTKARAFAYSCQERDGLVWVALRAPQSDIPTHLEATDDSFYTLTWGPYELRAEAPRVIENFLDVSHFMWVHGGLLGVPSHAEIPDYRVRQEEDRLVSDTIDIFQPDSDGRGRVVNSAYVYEVLGPLAARFRKTDPATGEVFSMTLYVTPVGHRASKAYALLSRNYDFDTPDQVFLDFQDTLMAQDRRVVESQRPEELPLDLQAELHLRSDRMAIAYRRYLKGLGVRVGVA